MALSFPVARYNERPFFSDLPTSADAMYLVLALVLAYGVTFAPLTPGHTQSPMDTLPEPSVGLVLQPYTARRGPDEWSIAPALLLPEATRVLEERGLPLAEVWRGDLSPGEKGRYGEWERLSLADAHLGRAVAPLVERGVFVVGLLGNCNSSLGMLAGLQNSGENGRPLRVGLIWIDAHADFNTPETTLSGWLGGMPVSVASGQSLARLRTNAGLEVSAASALPAR